MVKICLSARGMLTKVAEVTIAKVAETVTAMG